MPVVIDNVAHVRSLLDPMLEMADVRLLLDQVPEDVRFAVRAPGRDPDPTPAAGKAAIADYFESLGDLLRFWRAAYASSDGCVVARIEESYLLQPAGLTVRSELVLVFELSEGVITGLLVIEDPAPAATASANARTPAGRTGPVLPTGRSAANSGSRAAPRARSSHSAARRQPALDPPRIAPLRPSLRPLASVRSIAHADTVPDAEGSGEPSATRP